MVQERLLPAKRTMTRLSTLFVVGIVSALEGHSLEPMLVVPTRLTHHLIRRGIEASTLLENGKEAQKLNAKFVSMTADSACQPGDMACIAGGFSQCVGGKFVGGPCAAGLKCFAMPLLLKKGTSLGCDTEADATTRIANTGATGGLTGAGGKNGTAADSSNKEDQATAPPTKSNSTTASAGDPIDSGSAEKKTTSSADNSHPFTSPSSSNSSQSSQSSGSSQTPDQKKSKKDDDDNDSGQKESDDSEAASANKNSTEPSSSDVKGNPSKSNVDGQKNSTKTNGNDEDEDVEDINFGGTVSNRKAEEQECPDDDSHA